MSALNTIKHTVTFGKSSPRGNMAQNSPEPNPPHGSFGSCSYPAAAHIPLGQHCPMAQTNPQRRNPALRSAGSAAGSSSPCRGIEPPSCCFALG